MIKRFKAWWNSFHRWTKPGWTLDGKKTRLCKCCGQIEKYYEWEEAYIWAIVQPGDKTKPCSDKTPYPTAVSC